jgi:hypothetical protein
MAIKIVCDRCGKDIEDNTYYTIDIGARSVMPIYGISFDGAATNIINNLTSSLNKACYCKWCIDSIKDFINEGKVKE